MSGIDDVQQAALAARRRWNVEEIQGKRLDFSRNLNLLDWDIPNRTKLVRLIVVPKNERIQDDAERANAFATNMHATRADVFIVFENEEWDAWSWVGTKEGLVPHHDAHLKHPETVVVVMVIDREQVQWECQTHEFEVATIATAGAIDLLKLTNEGTVAPPPSPFRPLAGIRGGPGRPVVSGPSILRANQCNQLYKVSFNVWLDGPDEEPTKVDPDIYCDWS